MNSGNGSSGNHYRFAAAPAAIAAAAIILAVEIPRKSTALILMGRKKSRKSTPSTGKDLSAVSFGKRKKPRWKSVAFLCFKSVGKRA